MDFSIADAGSGAVAGIERLEKLCFSVPWTAEQIISQLPDENHFFITAVDSGGSVLGYVGAMLAADEGYISNVAVDPALSATPDPTRAAAYAAAYARFLRYLDAVTPLQRG